MQAGLYGPVDRRIEVPTGIAVFPKETLRPPRKWVEHAFNLQRWTVMPRGGHFAAFEQPELFVDDVRAFFRDLR
jgi:epoxide hydrolase